MFSHVTTTPFPLPSDFYNALQKGYCKQPIRIFGFMFQIKVPVVMPSEHCQVDLMLPVSADSSPCQQEGESPMGAEGGQEEGAGPVKEGGAQPQEEEGATTQAPPPDIAKKVALQRSISGSAGGHFVVGQCCSGGLFLTLIMFVDTFLIHAYILFGTWTYTQ